MKNEIVLRNYIKEILREEVKLQNEGFGNVVLDLVGLIPGVGEPFDILNAIDYARKGEYLFAALSLISVIPEVGDAVGKGGKLTVWVTKNFPKAAKMLSKVGPDVIKGIKKAKIAIQQNQSTIDKIFDEVEKKSQKDEKFKDISKHLPSIRGALSAFANSNEDNLENSNK